MRKLLAVFDGTKFSESTLKTAISLVKGTNSLVVGVFIHDLRYLNFTYAYTWDQPFIDVNAVNEIAEEDKEKIRLNVALFKRTCETEGVHHKIHVDSGIPLSELLRESTFADLIVIDANTGFFSLGNSTPAPFIKDLLADAHCPVLIVPHTTPVIKRVTVCYDGSASSIHAAKMFSYVLPDLCTLPATLLSANENNSNHIKSGDNFKDLVKLHFKQLNFEVLSNSSESDIITYLKQFGEDSLVVMGAYGRNAISRMIHQSLSNKVIAEVKVPVFITHL